MPEDVDQAAVFAGLGGADADAVERQDRAVAFGPWSLSPIMSKGVHVAWGASCNCHSNMWETKKRTACKKWVTIGNDGSDAARMRCKVWLMRGLKILADDTIGRHRHVWDHPTNSLSVDEFGSEADMDQAAAALVGLPRFSSAAKKPATSSIGLKRASLLRFDHCSLFNLCVEIRTRLFE